MSRTRAGNGLLAVLVALALAVAACSGAPPAFQGFVVAGWQELPSPQAGARVLVLRTVGARLVAFGSVPGPEGRAPAAWVTGDLTTWTPLVMRPVTGYGAQAELTLAAVVDGRISAYGLAYGGAHSNPRPTTWTGTVDGGVLTEHEQPYTLFGGEDAIATSTETATGDGFLLAGAYENRAGRYSAAVWTSADGVGFARDADAPGLTAEAGESTFARGAAGSLLVGSVQRADGTTSAVTWSPGPDGTWRRTTLPPAGPASASTAACDAQGCVVVGATADAELRQVCWPAGGARVDGVQRDVAGISQALVLAGRVWTVADVDHRAGIEVTGRDCTAPAVVAPPVASADAAIGVLGERLVLATGDPASGRLWVRQNTA